MLKMLKSNPNWIRFEIRAIINFSAMIGDGYDCVRPTCIMGVCWCPEGYQYIDEECQRTAAPVESVPSKSSLSNKQNILSRI